MPSEPRVWCRPKEELAGLRHMPGKASEELSELSPEKGRQTLVMGESSPLGS